MSERVIPVIDQRNLRATVPAQPGPATGLLGDRLGRTLRDVRISHSWCGFVAYTFDELMHIGRHEGMHYAMGYCGSGVGMGSYLGMKLETVSRTFSKFADDGMVEVKQRHIHICDADALKRIVNPQICQ
jgi:hypothetical protein